MHKLQELSRTYRVSSVFGGCGLDAEPCFVGRFSPRRRFLRVEARRGCPVRGPFLDIPNKECARQLDGGDCSKPLDRESFTPVECGKLAVSVRNRLRLPARGRFLPWQQAETGPRAAGR